MKPPPFDYYAPTELDEALELLAEHGDEAKLLAGGQSLVPLLALRLARPAVLIDMNRVRGLDGIVAGDSHVTLGSLTRERAAERSDVVASRVPLIAAALPLIGHPAIRTRGTIGGSLAHADPAAELPAVALAVDAEIVAMSRARGSRTIPAQRFFDGFFTTALDADEVLTEVRLPRSDGGTGASFEEACRRHGDFAMVGVGTSVTLSDGVISDVRIVMTGMADVPMRLRDSERALLNEPPRPDLFASVAEEAVLDTDPPADLHASASYRRSVGSVLIRRALTNAADRAESS